MVAQNVAIVPELLGWDAATAAARVDELLTLVRLDPADARVALDQAAVGESSCRMSAAAFSTIGPFGKVERGDCGAGA